ncbi:hypothetical protein ACP70R_006698 [Stipagrostis hirtigluma subsp. patula]
MQNEEDAKATSNKTPSKNKHARLHRSFLHFSKALKKLHGRGHADANGGEPSSSSSSAASFFSGCLHPRTHSFATGRRKHHDDDDGGDALAFNFQALRVGPAAVASGSDDGSSTTQDSDCRGEEKGDGMPAPAAPKAVIGGGGGGVAVVTFSAAPYDDFRRSMREMVDAGARREAGSGAAPRVPATAVDWDFMEELLFCYLQLNDRAVHKDILRAFTDTVAALRRRRRRATATKSRRTRGPWWQPQAGEQDSGDVAST